MMESSSRKYRISSALPRTNSGSQEPMIISNGFHCDNPTAVMEGCSNPGHTSIEMKCLTDLGQQAPKTGATLTYHDINYQVQVRNKGCCKGSCPKRILTNISGKCGPGMNAILGPTGSGKSSLLDVLAGRKDPDGLTGNILIDGNKVPHNFKCMVGYVVQDDVVMGTLSVRENLEFSASLRLSSDVSNKERKQRVDTTLQELGLTHCADTKIGNEFIRGVSGGERKRTNIGMELIIAPPILFLDEPTTGLDASTANAVMLLLKRLSMQGKTIVFSIHQPRYSIYRLFDNLTLLSKGEVVYNGPATDALSYFESIGYHCEEHNNPPDFFLDVINGDSTAVAATVDDINGNMNKSTENEDSVFDEDVSDRRHIVGQPLVKATDEFPIQRELVAKFKHSHHLKRLHEEIDPVLRDFENRMTAGQDMSVKRVEYATSFFHQLRVVCWRTGTNTLRNPGEGILQMCVNTLFGLIVGGIYFQLDTSNDVGIQNRIGAFFFVIMNMIFGNLAVVELFVKDRPIFIHESATGFYRVSVYFLAKILCDAIPIRSIPVGSFAVITYWMMGLKPYFGRFLIYFLTLFMSSMAACAVAFIISATTRKMAIANLCLALSYVFMMLFGGLLVNLESMGPGLSWLKYLSIFSYGLEALSLNELTDMTFCTYRNGTNDCVTGEQYLDKQGILHGSLWKLWEKELALTIICLGCMLIAYAQLRRIPKLK
ncbi:broad substrate specificity ATP-binding cassette transporter ABCG2-like isoform X2 [Liolophura sinensis]|uniref:broad substrate specificity ATP-binding cassette transporter ABCG2-like isoform X2 n=1 Tax=Liolophura sinensis TaxID=3198878 RepID=UPI0031596771